MHATSDIDASTSDATESEQATFHFKSRDRCNCPIHREQEGERDPVTAPLGQRFADRVGVRPISRERAGEIYAAHHAYMSDVPQRNIEHHGLYYQGQLMGAITYRYPLLSRKRLRFDADGDLLPEPHTGADYEALPETVRGTAEEIVPKVDQETVGHSMVLQGDRFIEAARICLGVRMPNLASAALARSQELIASNPEVDADSDYLLTFVRTDYSGSMVRALQDKGWLCTGWTTPKQASNREDKPIRERHKWRFICPVDQAWSDDQADLQEWSA